MEFKQFALPIGMAFYLLLEMGQLHTYHSNKVI